MPDYRRPPFDPEFVKRHLTKTRGAYREERDTKRTAIRSAEAANKLLAKKRDTYQCRFPHPRADRGRCKREAKESAHLAAKKMGGDPAGNRSETSNLITTCITVHDRYDIDKTVDIVPLTDGGANGPCEFYIWENEQWVSVGREREIGVWAWRRDAS